MGRSALRAFGAILLWCAFLAGGAAAAIAQERGAQQVQVAPAQLAGLRELSLGNRSLYWLDDGGDTRIDQLEAAAEDARWRLRRRDTQSGTRGALWVRFDAAAPPGTRWFLEATAAAHEKIELFYRDPRTGAWVVQRAGISVPGWQWPVPGRVPTFRLAVDEPRTIRYFVRLENGAADFLAPLTLLREDALREHREREQFLFGAYFGLMALITVSALVNGILFRDRAFLVFTLYLVLLGLGQLGRIGLGSQHLWGEWHHWNDTMLALWPGAATAAALWLVKIITESARLSRLLDLAVWALIAALLATTAVHVVVGNRTSVVVVLGLTALALVLVLVMVLWGWLLRNDRHLALVAVAFVPVVVLASFPLGRSLGLMPTNLLTRYGLFFATVVELPILYYAVATRLMARREAALRASALSSTDPLTGLPHRRALVQRLDASLAHARAQRQYCALLGVRISNLEAVLEEFGRETMDKALVVAASRLRHVVVGYDMAARVGEREFAVLMEAPVTRELATSRAQQLVASGLRQAEALPATLTLKFHVTVALLPRPQLDGAGSLQWVLDGLDAITPDARKMIRSLDSIP